MKKGRKKNQKILGLNQNIWLIIILIVFLALFIFLRLPTPDYWGSDALFHHVVVENNARMGKFVSENPLAVCYQGIQGIHPLGYYVVPHVLWPFLGVNTAFYVTPVLFGLAILILVFLLYRRLFCKKTAVLTLLLLTISYAFLTRTFAGSYRGDTFVLPFMLASLLFGIMYLETKSFKRKAIYAAICGGISGLSATMWNGYPLVIFVVLISIALYLLYTYVKGETIKHNANASAIAVLSQGLFLVIARLLTPFYAKGLNFFENYYLYFILLPFLALIAYIYLTDKTKKRAKMLIIPAILAILLAILKWNVIKTFLSGFGSVTREGMQVSELTVSLANYWNAYWILITLAILGIFSYLKMFNDKKVGARYVYYLGYMIPIAYVAFTARRFLFLSSLFMLLLVALFLRDYLNGKSQPVFKMYLYLLVLYIALYFSILSLYYMIAMIILVLAMFLTIKWHKQAHKFIVILILLFGMTLYTVHIAESSEDFTVQPPKMAAFDWIKENTYPSSCFITTQMNIQQVMHYTGRHAFLPSLGGLSGKRYQDIMYYYLTNSTLTSKTENLYIMATIQDLVTFGSSVRILGYSTNASISFLKPTTFIIDENYTGMEFVDVENNITYQVREYTNDDNVTYLRAFVIDGDNEIPLSKVITEDRNYIDPEGEPGCILRSNTIAYLDDVYCNSNLIKMISGQPLPGLELVYAKYGVNIYKVTTSP
ncbi:MAG: glycosyltransferase family 39 protein [Nanoarchaeota archaeon]|nr:glycosyltransferase family 39 protein [Nanoarchaeota archaeon]